MSAKPREKAAPSYAARVAAARAKTGLSLRQLGVKAAVSTTHLYDIEKGRRAPSPAVRERIDAALGLGSD